MNWKIQKRRQHCTQDTGQTNRPTDEQHDPTKSRSGDNTDARETTN